MGMLLVLGRRDLLQDARYCTIQMLEAQASANSVVDKQIFKVAIFSD
jgi:hypothetical protein